MTRVNENNQDQEIEQYLLAGLMENNQAIYELGLKPEYFFVPAHQDIYEKIESIFTETGEVTYAGLSRWAKSREFIEGEDGSKYLLELQSSVVSSLLVNLKNYSSLVKDYYRKRKLAETLEKATEDLSKPDSELHNVIAEVNKATNIEDSESNNLASGSDVYKSILEQSGKPLKCFSTGITELDKAMAGGFYSGWTYGFCGAEKSGKTMFATTVAYNQTQLNSKPAKILYIALEMGSVQIEQRSIARQLGFNSIKFFDKPHEIQDKLKHYQPNDNMVYMDMPGATLDDILLAISKAKSKYNIDGFILDYWQLVRGSNPRDTEERHLRDVAQSISDYARKNKLFCLMLAQMNQDGKLFGGNGLKKACDQLYMIEQIEEKPKERWLRMEATRYTLLANVGSESSPCLTIDNIGPHFKELGFL